MKLINSKLPLVGTTIFSEMSALANNYNAINLSQGFPGFNIDENLPKLVTKFMSEGKNQYAPMPGIIELRVTLSNYFNQKYKVDIDPNSEITITAGATQAIYNTISAIIEKEDEVILFSPAYDCYSPAIEVHGGIPIFIPLEHPSYSISWETVKSKITDKTKLIIINSPHNPTGSLLSKHDLETLSEIVKDTNIIVLSDEVYEHITFDGENHESILSYPELKKRGMVVYSFGKSLHVTGWKLGFCVGPEWMMKEFRKIHQYTVFSSNSPMQYAINEYILNYNPFENTAEFYERKRDVFLSSIKDSRFKIIPCKGTYFQLLDYTEITEMNDVEFAKKLTIENGIASIPISVFYPNKKDNKVLRFCFAKEDDLLIKAGKILCKI
jgi:methionine aminotransferase|tara:strand:- start:4863 stop:6008 length:1146 start_codon:yes stop_codon:yes gene_type:complete